MPNKEPVAYYEAMTDRGTWEAKTLDLLRQKMVNYYYEPDEEMRLPFPVIHAVVMHENDDQMLIHARALGQFISQCEADMKRLISDVQDEITHDKEISSLERRA